MSQIKVVMVEPEKEAYITEIDNSLSDMQKAVGGYIETVHPFEDDVVLVCNEEGKYLGLPYARAIMSPDGNIADIIAGTFFLCYAPEDAEDFGSLPDDLASKYLDRFRFAEMFIQTPKGLSVLKY